MKGSDLRRWRRRYDLTQAELGELLGTGERAPHRSIQEWESGRVSVPKWMELALAELERRLEND